MLRKYAACEVISAWEVPEDASPGSLTKAAHRVEFEYTPRPGYLYVRSRMISSRCNDNWDEFPAGEIAKSYDTFLNKPAFVNHKNANHRRARGVIIRVVLHEDRNPDGTPDTWAEGLHEIDARTFPRFAKAILTGRIDRTSMGCFIPGTPVTLADGTRKSIESVEEGDEVLTHTGKTEPVTFVMTREYDGVVYDVRTYGQSCPLVMTPDHPLWIRRVPMKRNQALRRGLDVFDPTVCLCGDDFGTRRSLSAHVRESKRRGYPGTHGIPDETDRQGWVRAEDVRNGDWVLTPAAGSSISSGSASLARLLGYYAAEGNLCWDRKRRGNLPVGVEWNFHEDEISYIDEIDAALHFLGYSMTGPYSKVGSRGVAVRCNSPSLADQMLSLGGQHSWEKRLSPEVMSWDPDIQRILLETYWNGDGHYEDGRVEASTASENLAQQLFMIAVRCGIPMTPPVFQHSPSARNAKFPGGRTSAGRPKWSMQAVLDPLINKDGTERSNLVFTDESGTWRQVTGVMIREYSGNVYNFDVDGDDSYVAADVAVHNCDVDFSKCSACGNIAADVADYCTHIPGSKGKKHTKYTSEGKRKTEYIREECFGLRFFENSFLVEEPADPTAVVTGVDDRGLTMAASRRVTATGDPDFRDHLGNTCLGCGERVKWSPHPAKGGWKHYSPGREYDHAPMPSDPEDKSRPQQAVYGGTHCVMCHEPVRISLDHLKTPAGGWSHHDGRRRDHLAIPADPQAVYDAIPGIKARQQQVNQQVADSLHSTFEQMSGHPLPRRPRGDKDQMPPDPFLASRHIAAPHPDARCPDCGRGFEDGAGGEPLRLPVGAGETVPSNLIACHGCGQVYDGSKSGDQARVDRDFAQQALDAHWSTQRAQKDLFEKVTGHGTSPQFSYGDEDRAMRDRELEEHQNRGPGGIPLDPQRPGTGRQMYRHKRERVMNDPAATRPFEPDLPQHLSALHEAAPRYPDPADHPWFREHPVSHLHVIRAFHDTTPGERASGASWYSDAHHVAKAIAGGDAALGAGVLSAYSPRTFWPANMFHASRSLREGRAIGPGEGANVMGMHQKPAQKIMDGAHWSEALRGPKTRAFAHLIEHGGESGDDIASGTGPVVVDRHAMSVAAGHRLSDAEAGSAPLDHPHYYGHVARQYQKAAADLSDHYGRHIAPHEVQASTWLRQVRLNQAEDSEQASGGKGRNTRNRNAQDQWNQVAEEHHPSVRHLFHGKLWPRTALPRGIKFHFRPASETQDMHHLWATVPGRTKHMDMAHFRWHPDTGEVGSVTTPDRLRRDGVATALWDRARELSAEHGLAIPQHSDIQFPEGKAWAESVDSRGIADPVQGQEPMIPRKSRDKTRMARGTRRTAYGETRVPPEVDTLRDEECPVCREKDVFSGERCAVCGFVSPPALFKDPDLQRAKQVDLRQDQQDQQDQQNAVPPGDFPGAPGAMPQDGLQVPGQEDSGQMPDAQQGSFPDADSQLEHPDQIAPDGVPGAIEGEQGADAGLPSLMCPACGFTCPAGGAVTETTTPDQPGAMGFQEGTPCPACGQGILMSSDDMQAAEGLEPGAQQNMGQEAVPPVQPANPAAPLGEEQSAAILGQQPMTPGAEDQGGIPVEDEDGDEPVSGDPAAPPQDEDGEDGEEPLADDPVDDNGEPMNRRTRKSSREGGRMDQALRTALAAQQGKIDSLTRLARQVIAQNSVLHAQLQVVGSLAGLQPEMAAIERTAALKFQADENNPASPVPDPPEQPAPESTEQALQPDAMDDPRRPGMTPGSVTNVPAMQTTTPLRPGVEDQTPPATNLIDVTAPVQGTNPAQDGGVPLSQRRIETDVRVGPPMNPEIAFPWNDKAGPDSGQDAMTGPQSFDQGGGGGAPSQRAASHDEQVRARMMGSMRLASLRLQAGLSGGDQISVAGQIEQDASLSDAMMAHEIRTLTAMAQRAPRQEQRRPVQRTAATRAVPSLSSGPRPVMAAAQGGYGGEDDLAGDADLFM